jgi:hypothetical protein
VELTATSWPTCFTTGMTSARLQSCATAAADPVQSVPTLLSDINMLVLTGDLERTRDEYLRLFEDADLRLTRVIPVLFPYGIFEGSEK